MTAGVAALARAIGTLELDLPILFGVGVASFFFLRLDRRLLVALFLVQLGLVVLLATYQADQLRPRRFIMVDSYCLVAIAWTGLAVFLGQRDGTFVQGTSVPGLASREAGTKVEVKDGETVVMAGIK